MACKEPTAAIDRAIEPVLPRSPPDNGRPPASHPRTKATRVGVCVTSRLVFGLSRYCACPATLARARLPPMAQNVSQAYCGTSRLSSNMNCVPLNAAPARTPRPRICTTAPRADGRRTIAPAANGTSDEERGP